MTRINTLDRHLIHARLRFALVPGFALALAACAASGARTDRGDLSRAHALGGAFEPGRSGADAVREARDQRDLSDRSRWERKLDRAPHASLDTPARPAGGGHAR